MRISSVEASSSRQTKRKNIFLRILAALHVSRRREARRVIRHHSHLIDKYSRVATSSVAADSLPPGESSRNAHGNKAPLRADDRTRRIASPSFWNQLA
ncbi:MAG: hypothetical protein K2X57_10675 [Xanthobacteraceae bacterium]|nr:hypothetical protein [Xanthobacteraceae bacterium]